MPIYALIQDNKLWELAEFDSIEGRFPAEMEWLEVSGQDLREGLLYDRASGTFHEPSGSEIGPTPPAALKPKRRWLGRKS